MQGSEDLRGLKENLLFLVSQSRRPVVRGPRLANRVSIDGCPTGQLWSLVGRIATLPRRAKTQILETGVPADRQGGLSW